MREYSRMDNLASKASKSSSNTWIGHQPRKSSSRSSSTCLGGRCLSFRRVSPPSGSRKAHSPSKPTHCRPTPPSLSMRYRTSAETGCTRGRWGAVAATGRRGARRGWGGCIIEKTSKWTRATSRSRASKFICMGMAGRFGRTGCMRGSLLMETCTAAAKWSKSSGMEGARI